MWLLMPKQEAPPQPAVQASAPAALDPASVEATVALPVEAEKPEPVAAKPAPARKPWRAVPAASAPRRSTAPAAQPAKTPEPAAPAEPAATAPAEPKPEPRPITAELSKPSLPPPPTHERIAPPKPPEPRSATIPAGTLVAVRLNEKVSTATHYQGDTVQLTLDAPLIVNGMVIAERGSRQLAKVVSAAPPGKVKGRAAIALELAQLRTADGQTVEVNSETFTHEAASTAGKDAAKVGVLAGIGAAIGAIAGGGKGAAIGAGVGGAAGAGTVMTSRGGQAEIENETRLTFKLKQPVTLTEKLK
ncbi:MAG: hypothetical protein C0504_16560 [Candidatus Solibacter sp.]|nr:hypothetical protein [Candidatus Solibacter sp.]